MRVVGVAVLKRLERDFTIKLPIPGHRDLPYTSIGVRSEDAVPNSGRGRWIWGSRRWWWPTLDWGGPPHALAICVVKPLRGFLSPEHADQFVAIVIVTFEVGETPSACLHMPNNRV